NVVHFDPATHKIVDALLPWFVNGTLDDEERALVQKHVEQCERCRREVAWLTELHAACAAPNAAPAVQKLRQQLMTSRSARAIAPWPRALTAAQLAAILVLGYAVVQSTLPSTPYRTLGAADSAARATASLVVVFDPATPEADLRRMLRDA